MKEAGREPSPCRQRVEIPMTKVIFRAAEIPARRWGADQAGLLRPLNSSCGVSGVGLSQIELPANARGIDHDERGSGQEEVYLVLAGEQLGSPRRQYQRDRLPASGCQCCRSRF